MAISLQTTAYNLIYVYKTKEHPDAVKIGKATVNVDDINKIAEPNCETIREAAKKRINEQTTTAAVDYELLWAEVAWFKDGDKEYSFHDSDVHDILLSSGYQKKDFPNLATNPQEWFKVDVETAKKAITAVKNGQEKIDGPVVPKKKQIEIRFREEQTDAIVRTLNHFNSGEKKMLWNAKMRFGKTLCALELINKLDVEKVLILTHRPTVRRGWFEDFHLIKYSSTYLYGSKKGHKHNCINDPDNKPDEFVTGKDLATLQKENKENGCHYIYFASVQDLRGHEKGTKKWKDNNQSVFETEWDLVIFDEAHEGTQTALGKNLIDDLLRNRPYQLYLSGTPYNILDQFNEDEIYTWDYNMEQEAKENWPRLHPNEPNPYEGLAKLLIHTYHIGDVYNNNPEYVKSDDDFFNFTEFFRTWTGDKNKDGEDMPIGVGVGQFVHEADVISFLDLLVAETYESYYPYSSESFRNALSHTLWMVPGVASAARLQQLLNSHKIHTEYGYEIVNVAGDGEDYDRAGDNENKKEKIEKRALERVLGATKNNKRTITLSCGRLTTGVSIPEWTGVFMLSGGYSSGAANYMQTIFRGQTPYKNGAIKTNCYAFDFAPDRTLTVISDYLKIQPSSCNRKKKSGDEVTAIDKSIKFMPVISMKGGQEIEYDSKNFISKVNQVYTEHVLANGFRSKHLFKNIHKFTEEDHLLLEEIGKKLNGSKVKLKSDGTIDVSSNELKQKDNAKGKKQKKEPQKPSGNKPKNKEKKNKEANSRKVLDLIFVRFPLLLFGCVENTEGMTIDDLLSESFIDDESWAEFMPSGLSKVIFKQISHLVEVDRLFASTAEIIKQVRDIDEFSIEERIKRISGLLSRFHFPDKETVLTPWRVVNLHLSDTIGGYDFYNEQHTRMEDKPRFVKQGEITDQIFGNVNTRLLEINSKSGVYPLWLTYTLWRTLKKDRGVLSKDEEWKLWKNIVENNIFTICKTRMAEKITIRVLVGFKTYIKPNIVTIDKIVEKIKNNKESLKKEICNPSIYGNSKITGPMKFDAIVSNPPYQLMDGGGGSSSTPIYNEFIELAQEIKPSYYSFIIPARWYVGGKGLDEFRNDMLKNRSIQILHDYIDSGYCFKKVAIEGGVCYFLGNNNHKGCCKIFIHKTNGTVSVDRRNLNEGGATVLIRDKVAVDIFKKLQFGGGTIQKITHPRNIFKINKIPTEYVIPEDAEYRLTILGRENNQRVVKKLAKEFHLKNESELEQLVNNYKIFVSKADGAAGQLGNPLPARIMGKAELGLANQICTETFLAIGPFSATEAQNVLKYASTKFFRFCVGLRKSKNMTQDTYSYVPKFDFSSNNQIDWGKSTSEIDKQLYAIHNLSKDEINYIESMIKPME